MRGLVQICVFLLALAAHAAPADQALARWTLLQGGRVAIAGRLISDIADLPPTDYQVDMVDWVAVNAVPEDLERMIGLRALRELRLPGPLWNRNADGGKDLSTQLRFLSAANTLEKLTFSDHFLDRIRFKDAGLDAIKGLTNLRELALRQSEIQGSGLRHFPKLRNLDLTLCPIADLAPLLQMPDLERLWAGDTFVADLAPLAKLTRLHDLDLHGTAITDESIPALAGLTALRRLDLQGTNISDAAIATLERLPLLESLNLYRTKISNDGLARLSRLPALRHLDIRYTRVTATGFDSFRTALPQARILFAGAPSRPQAPPPSGDLKQWITALGGTTRSGHVGLRGIPLNAASVAALARFPGLRSLDLEATGLGDSALASLATLTSLEELNLNQNPISDAGLNFLAPLKNLHKLALNNTYVEALALPAWPLLADLSLLGTPVVELAALTRLPALRRLNLAETDITGQGIRTLASLSLERLDLSGTDVDDVAPWQAFTSLTWLSLRDTRITDKSLLQLAPLTRRTYLDLARTRSTNAAAPGLAKLTNLVTLNLAYADLNDAGMAPLAALTNLQTLILDSTLITDDSAPLLAKLSKLQTLDLYHSLITAPALAELKRALPAARIIWDKESGFPHRRRA